MSTPTISVVIPTYDRVGRLESAIESVLSQDEPGLELIVVDDGSHDETPELLARISEREPESRFRVIRQENGGQPRALAAGWEAARCDLLSYVSSDDYLLPGALTRLVAAAAEHPDAEVFYPLFDLVDEQDRPFDTMLPLQHTFADAFRWWLCIPGVGLTFRRSALDRLGPWNPENRRFPDFEWHLRAGDTQYVQVPEVLGAWRSHPGSITVSQGDDPILRARTWLDLYEELIADESLPPAVQEFAQEALASLLIGAGLGAGPVTRFEIFDLASTKISVNGRAGGEASWVATRRALRQLQTELDGRTQVQEHREAEARSLREALQHAEVAIADLEAQLAAHQAEIQRKERERIALLEELSSSVPATTNGHASSLPQHRPLWLILGRTLTPRPWRDPIGAAVHRRMYR